MDTKRQLFESIANDYSLILLNWAYKKIGNRTEAEDLTQEVFLQIYTAITKSDTNIVKLDHFVWKIAHYTWCNYLRKNEHYKGIIAIDDLNINDEKDFVLELLYEQEYKKTISDIRKRISHLNYLKREIMISFYIDGKSVKDIATKYNISVANVKWHLHKARIDIKEEIKMADKEYMYRPRRISMGIAGKDVAALDTAILDKSLTMQNICYVCYESGKTIEDISEVLGIPMAYIESDIKWLVDKEFMSCINGKYATTFIIEDLKRSQEIYEIYMKHKEKLMDVIVNGLLSREQEIRNIGFYGSDKSMDKMLWFFIYQFCMNKNVPYHVDAPIRPDGGKYFPLGFDITDYDNEEIEAYNRGWMYNGPISNDNFIWFGTYDFGNSEIQHLIDGYYEGWLNLQKMLVQLIVEDVKISALDEDKKLLCAELVQKGYIKVVEDKAYPEFYVFTEEQYNRLKNEIFAPILNEIKNEFELLGEEFEQYFLDKIPAQLKHYKDVFINMALNDLTFISTISAFNDGKLFVPKDSSDGEFLTLMYLKKN